MLNPVYLVMSRNGIFYLRWPLPRQLHPQNKPSQIKVSLQTRDPRKALRLSRPLIHIGEHYNSVGIAYNMDYQDLRTTLQNHFRQLREQTKAEIDATGGLNAADRELYRTSLAVAEQANNTDTPLSLVKPDNELLARFIDKYGLAISKGTDEYDRLERDMKRGYRRFLHDVLNYDALTADFDLDPPAQSMPSMEQPAPVQKGISLNDTIKDYLSDKDDGKKWASKTESEKVAHLALLIEILDADADVRTFGPMDAKRVKDILRVYPTNREKLKATRGNRPLSEILDLPNVPKLHTTSVNKYLQSYGDLFNWAKQSGHVNQNIFTGLSIRQNKSRSQDNRAAFKPYHMRLIIAAILSNKDELAKKDYQKWGPLIGIYSGARLNEIAQLHLKDIRKEEDVWCFDFNDEGDRKSLKTEAARRVVPIHQRLIELGLISHVEDMRRSGQLKLFPSFTYDPKNGWGRHLSRHFNNTLLPKLGIKSKELVFHSLRHTFVTQLMRADVDVAVVQALVGHTRQGVTHQNYFRLGYAIRQLNDALQQLSFEDLGAGDEAAVV
ncbi:site-specific integrase [Phyllobacterium pellucidum]|uniref:site-specific integrase n=1 Tax=Phyllobacterium pellucidum TaxID=2740464 RepID=UPI001D14A2EB|nr:site-specific integrase [Phyllobacterium sp. T1018]UGY08319.1 site-specific integrase [Phyllobacterium sp. T1018]